MQEACAAGGAESVGFPSHNEGPSPNDSEKFSTTGKF
jgi:hypothetical protein